MTEIKSTRNLVCVFAVWMGSEERQKESNSVNIRNFSVRGWKNCWWHLQDW
jgi:hypothetical protein